MSLCSVPREVLQLKYNTACRILTDQLTHHEKTNSTALLKSVGSSPSCPHPFLLSFSLQLVLALSLLLEAQPVSTWSDSHCQKVFQTILNFTIHPKPRVWMSVFTTCKYHVSPVVWSSQLRKAAQGSVVSMLCEGTSSGDYHPAVTATAKHCRYVLSLGGRGWWGLVGVLCILWYVFRFRNSYSACAGYAESLSCQPPNSGTSFA